MKNIFLLVSVLLFSGSIYAEDDSDGSGYDDATSDSSDCDQFPCDLGGRDPVDFGEDFPAE